MRRTISIVFNTLAALALALCALRYAVTLWPLLIVNSTQAHIAFATAAGLAVTHVIRRNVVSAVLMVVALGLGTHAIVMMREFAIEPTAQERAAGPELRVISFNMLSENLPGASAVAAMLIASKADVAVVLEGAPLFLQLERLDAAFPYRIGCGALTPTCDLMIFSRHPLEDEMIGNLSELRKDRVMSARITVPAGTFRLVAAHLSKPYFDDYHIKELNWLQTFMRNTTEPLILAGDFNSGTIAPDMQAMLRHLRLRTAPQEPGTWPVQIAETGLGVPIDHIYSRPPLVPLSVERLDSNYGSNHFGLQASFVFRRP
jgi:endonuclease/exonuclease/phosphatase (EEP) superfamily protein YafD